MYNCVFYSNGILGACRGWWVRDVDGITEVVVIYTKEHMTTSFLSIFNDNFQIVFHNAFRCCHRCTAHQPFHRIVFATDAVGTAVSMPRYCDECVRDAVMQQ